jgi:nicotinamidase-related amidase
VIELDPKTTALVLIDLQKGLLGHPLAPRSLADVTAASARIAERFRAAGAPVVLVNVAFHKTLGDALSSKVDQSRPHPEGGYPPAFSEIVDGLAHPDDIFVTKRNWGAFYGTDLDVQLRRRGIATIVLGGVATNMGVESTARQAHEHGYDVVLAEDLCASLTAEMHAFAIGTIMPMLARVVASGDVALTA